MQEQIEREHNQQAEQSIGQMTDAELDALLAQWAADEIEPPAGFHETAMARIRAEQAKAMPPAKKNNIISLFASHKKWASVAAAAVLMLFCIPAMQGHTQQGAVELASEEQMAQGVPYAASVHGADSAQNKAQMADSNTNSTVQEAAEHDGKQAAAQKTAVNDDTQSGANTAAPMLADAQTQPAQEEYNYGIAVAQELDESPVAQTAAYSPEETQTAASTGARIAAYSQTEGTAAEDTMQTLEELEQTLQTQQNLLNECEAQLQANPDDAALQEKVQELRAIVQELEQKIAERKAAEQKAEE